MAEARRAEAGCAEARHAEAGRAEMCRGRVCRGRACRGRACRDVQRYAGDSEVSKRLFKTSRVLLPNRDAKICSLIIIIKEK